MTIRPFATRSAANRAGPRPTISGHSIRSRQSRPRSCCPRRQRRAPVGLRAGNAIRRRLDLRPRRSKIDLHRAGRRIVRGCAGHTRQSDKPHRTDRRKRHRPLIRPRYSGRQAAAPAPRTRSATQTARVGHTRLHRHCGCRVCAARDRVERRTVRYRSRRPIAAQSIQCAYAMIAYMQAHPRARASVEPAERRPGWQRRGVDEWRL